MRLDCVTSIIIITVNINKVLSALFLLPRLSLPNIYKYRTVPRRRRNRMEGKEIRKGERGKKGRRKMEKEGRRKKSKNGKDAGNEKGVRRGTTQSGQYHRLQKALASCVQTGRGCMCPLWTGGWWWRWRSTGTLARKPRGRRGGGRSGVGGGAEG